MNDRLRTEIKNLTGISTLICSTTLKMLPTISISFKNKTYGSFSYSLEERVESYFKH